MRKVILLLIVVGIAAWWIAGAIGTRGAPLPATDVLDHTPTTAPLRLQLEVSDAGGNVPTYQLLVVASYPSHGLRKMARGTPTPEGLLSFNMEIDEVPLKNGERLHLEVWRDSEFADLLPSNRYYFDATEGEAAFPEPGVARWESQQRAYRFRTEAHLSLPAEYGCITVNNTVGQDLSLTLHEGANDSDFFGDDPYQFDRRRAIGDQTTRVEVYSWSNSGIATVRLLGPNGSELAQDVLKRTGSVEEGIIIAPMRETLLSFAVQETAYPTAYCIVVVDPQYHEPNSASITGSDVEFWAQRRRSECTIPFSFENGAFTYSVSGPAQDLAVELWDKGKDEEGYNRYCLVGSEHVRGAEVNPTVHFD